MEAKFYICPICGNIITKIIDSGVTPVCCGQEMEEMKAKEVDGQGKEKHLPVVNQEGKTLSVKVGEVAHPMEEKHHINLIALESEDGIEVAITADKAEASAVFTPSSKPTAVYEHCNLHGLWKVVL